MKRKTAVKYGIIGLLGLIFALIFVLIMCHKPVNTNETSTADDIDNGFYVSTATVPEEAVNYAVNNVFRFLLSRSKEDSFNPNNVAMGSPFTITKESVSDADIYYFPIFLNTQVLYTFRVYKDGSQYTGILSPYIAEPLNRYLNATTPASPLHIYMENGNVMAQLNDTTDILEKSHYNYEAAANSAFASIPDASLEVTNLFTNIEFKK